MEAAPAAAAVPAAAVPPSEALTKLEQRAVDQLESLVASGLGPRVGARHAEARPAAAAAPAKAGASFERGTPAPADFMNSS